MPKPTAALDRRTFCACSLAATALACGGGGGGSASTPGPAPIPPGPKTTTDTKAGLLATTAGTIRDYRDLGAFWLIRDAGGIYAMTAICTHQGCTLGQGGPAFACPCHGSQFDLAGAVAQGPAATGLAHLAVTEPTPGAPLVVNTGQPVPAGTRLT
jgi:nitrite reductase/ring-hydroxylating ferredoxin subunit